MTYFVWGLFFVFVVLFVGAYSFVFNVSVLFVEIVGKGENERLLVCELSLTIYGITPPSRYYGCIVSRKCPKLAIKVGLFSILISLKDSVIYIFGNYSSVHSSISWSHLWKSTCVM